VSHPHPHRLRIERSYEFADHLRHPFSFRTLLDSTTPYSEALSEQTSFQARELAALVASKLYYHLGQFDDSLSFALGAGKLFNIEGAATQGGKDIGRSESEYVETVIGEYTYLSFPLLRVLFR
jgi:hypothetical protein